MSSTLEATTLDLGAIKERQQQAWASGDFAVVAARIVLVAEQLCDSADLHAGWRVLDVATGSGNAALAAARHGCTTVGVDYVPALLERGRTRAEAESPAGVASPMLWGTEAHLRGLFGEHFASLEVTERTFTFRFGSAEEFVAFFRLWYGPILTAFAALEGAARRALKADLVALAHRFDRLRGDAVAIPATYTEAVARTR